LYKAFTLGVSIANSFCNATQCGRKLEQISVL
jgi:hypothetical protein